jgi:hypothetical protein
LAGPDVAAVLGAVRDDIRQTLRCAWLDPAFDAAAGAPAFFTAAWSAIRPNVGKSFLLLSRALRTEAVDAVRATMAPPDVRKRIQGVLSVEEVRRVEEAARAGHLAAAKLQIVVHALNRAIRRDRIPGTGREEPSIRRGVPEWQRWMAVHPIPDEAKPILEEAGTLAGGAPPAAMRVLARWPAALSEVWSELRASWDSPAWRAAAVKLRRMTLAGVATLPHPIDLQWTALRARGFTEDERVGLAGILTGHDASMATHTLAAAFAWVALGTPEIGVEG